MTKQSLVSLAALCATLTVGLIPAGGSAQTAVAPKDVTAGDVVTKPLSDMNLKKEDIPPILLNARDKPYDLTGLRRCSDLQGEVRRLDAVLGDDIDVVEEKTAGEKRGNTVGSLAKSVVGSLIPFGGIIREISGANENQRQWQVALYAGSVRRAFIKGVGQQRGCRYPAHAASAADVARLTASREAEDRNSKAESRDTKESKDDTRYESRAVVQPTPRRR
ncbi:hypothetical protein [Novosphingobium sp.]|uniref:hypothetical protein n=1 Tax=Novosphingobium sp. TaxID=1874826 RepID=UPI00352B1569